MIHKLTMSNFRSLGRHVTLTLDRLTVLAGPNGSGKSNVVDALQFLADCMHLGLEGAINKRHGIDAVRRWSSGHPFNVGFSIDLNHEQGQATYSFELAGDRAMDYRVKRESLEGFTDGQPIRFDIEGAHWKEAPKDLRPKLDPLSLALPLMAGDERFRPVADELRAMAVYSIFPDALRQPQKYDPSKPMERHGANWVSVLKDQREDSWKPDLVGVLHKLTGDIIDVRPRAVGGYLTVQFEHRAEGSTDDASARSREKRKRFDASQESDGTLRVAGLMTAILQEPAPSLVALEEPELTVHPGVLSLLKDYIEEASHRVQVVLTTHSPDLLDLMDSDAVRVIEKRQGITTVKPLEDGQRDVVRQGLLTLGEVLRSEGLRQQIELPLQDAGE
ncbi:MAG: AAA family ATPase [Myxococcota bacterium]